MPALPLHEQDFKKLTLPPGKVQEKFHDTKITGLALRVGARSKMWIVSTTDDGGKRRLSTIGEFPRMGLKEARAAAQAAIGGARIGVDLIGQRDERKAKARKEAIGTLEHWWGRYDAEHVATLRPNSQRSIRGAIVDLVAVAGKLPIAAVMPSHIKESLERRRARGATASTFHARATANGFFKWLVEEEAIQFNPVAAVRSPKRYRGQRVLTDGELQDFLALLEEAPKNAADVMMFLILTGRRIGEAVGLTFDRVDMKAGTMIVTEADDKEGAERLYPMSMAALAIVARRRLLTNGEYVFQGVRQGAAPTQSLAAIPLRRLLKSKAWKHRGFTLHDLRRTFRTTASRLGVRFEVAELLLGHALTGVHAVYDRHSYTEEMRGAAELISKHVEGLMPRGAKH